MSSPRPQQPATPTEHERAVLEEVLQSIRGVQFGSVLITIHQGEVVGIETATKKRLSSDGSKP
jgi:hypothetical protein